MPLLFIPSCCLIALGSSCSGSNCLDSFGTIAALPNPNIQRSRVKPSCACFKITVLIQKNKDFLAYLLFLCCTIWFPKLFSAPSRFQLPVKIRGKHLVCWSWGCEKHTKLALATQRRGERAMLWKHLHLHRNWVLFKRCVVKVQVSHLSRHCSFMSWIMAPSCTFSFRICTLSPFRRTLISLGCPVISGGCSWCEGHVGPSSVSLRPEPEHIAFRSCKTSDFFLKQRKFLTRLSPCLF